MPGRRIPRRPPAVADIEYARRTWRGGIDGDKSVPRPVPLDRRLDLQMVGSSSTLEEQPVEPEPSPCDIAPATVSTITDGRYQMPLTFTGVAPYINNRADDTSYAAMEGVRIQVSSYPQLLVAGLPAFSVAPCIVGGRVRVRMRFKHNDPNIFQVGGPGYSPQFQMARYYPASDTWALINASAYSTVGTTDQVWQEVTSDVPAFDDGLAELGQLGIAVRVTTIAPWHIGYLGLEPA